MVTGEEIVAHHALMLTRERAAAMSLPKDKRGEIRKVINFRITQLLNRRVITPAQGRVLAYIPE